ncbi:MAG: VOC family protein [Terriglobales bacterium]
MRKIICCAVLVIATRFAHSAENRPRITGIDHVAFYTTSPGANKHFYMDVLGLGTGDMLDATYPLETRQTQRFVMGTQWVGYSPAPDPKSTNRLDHVAFATDNCDGLRRYLATHGIKVPESLGHLKNGSTSFTVNDPEGHRIEFIQPKSGLLEITGDPVSHHMIHVGFIVNDRDAEDHFYRDILGFHLYWQGGMQNGKNDWVAMQVPDGTDWLEYMLNVEPNADQHTIGVMNHISLGVKDIKQAQAKLEKHGWKPHGDDKAQMGRDGKWQLNLYDPDFTRIELMEFKPVQKPCCSEFQGQHPSE